jgi:hypothetical protein
MDNEETHQLLSSYRRRWVTNAGTSHFAVPCSIPVAAGYRRDHVRRPRHEHRPVRGRQGAHFSSNITQQITLSPRYSTHPSGNNTAPARHPTPSHTFALLHRLDLDRAEPATRPQTHLEGLVSSPLCSQHPVTQPAQRLRLHHLDYERPSTTHQSPAAVRDTLAIALQRVVPHITILTPTALPSLQLNLSLLSHCSPKHYSNDRTFTQQSTTAGARIPSASG